MASLSTPQISRHYSSQHNFLHRNTCIGSNNVRFRIRAADLESKQEPDLSVTVNGLKMPNPFVIGSGPPGTNYTVMKRAFDEGWGAVIAKTVSLEADKVVNVTPRYARLRAGANGSAKGQIIGWQNIELISDRPLETMLKEFKQLKEEYPDRILIASIMEEYNKHAWEELVDRVEQTGVDAIEVNFSCPHGMPERKMGAAVGQDCILLEEVCDWVNAKATIPVWAKMTPNITDITEPARVALKSGCEGIAAINTIMSVMGINLTTLRPEPCVEGYSTPGGYSCKAVHPIALAKVMNIAKMLKSEFNYKDYSLSGIGGVETGGEAAEFILLGANTVQVCTGVMMHGYGLVKKLCSELSEFMIQHNFSSIEEFRGASLPYFTTHMDLVQRQQEAIRKRKAIKQGLQSDKDWTGDGFVKETESMVSRSASGKRGPVIFLTDPSDGRSSLRPVDVLIYSWFEGKHACVDVTCVYSVVGFGDKAFEVGDCAAAKAKVEKHERACGKPTLIYPVCRAPQKIAMGD